MPIVNIMCQICHEVYTNSHDIVSTRCGHLFHTLCLNSWLARENSCPQCRATNTKAFKIQLGFAEQEEEPKQHEDIETLLKSSEEQIAELLLKNQELKNNLFEIREQYTFLNSDIQKLEENLSLMSHFEADFLMLQAQYTDVIDTQNDLEQHINQLNIENECKVRELEEINNENEELNSSLVPENAVWPSNALGKQLDHLHLSIKNIIEQLQKEIQQTTLLSADTLKLKTQIKELLAVETKENQNPTIRRSNHNYRKVEPNGLRKESSRKFENYDNAVVIKCLSFGQLHENSLEGVVIDLAAKMNQNLNCHDLLKVNFMRARRGRNCNSKNLLVQFKHKRGMEAFLCNRRALYDFPETKSVIIKEFVEPKLHELYVYTKKMLRNQGLIELYIENNKLFARKTEANANPVHICNKEQVKQMVNITDA